MKKYFLVSFIASFAMPLWGQKINIFDVFKDKEIAYAFDYHKDTLWVGGYGRLVARAGLYGHKIAEWDDLNSPLREHHKIMGVAKSLTDHAVWMALGTYGIAMKSGSQWRFWKSKDIIKDSLISEPDIQMIMTTVKGEVFACDSKFKKIVAYQNGQWQDLYIPPYDIDNIFHLLRHPKGGVWWVNRYGVYGLQDGNFVSKTVAGQKTRDAVFNSKGELTITQYDGWVIRYIGNTYTYIGKIVLPYPLAPLLTGVDPSDRVILLTSDKKIVQNGTVWEEEPYALNPAQTPTLQNVVIGANDQVWFFRASNKMALFKQGQLTVYQPDISPGGPLIGSLDGQAMWLRTNEHIVRIDIPTEKTTTIPLPPDQVDFFTPGPDNQGIWAFTSSGLQYYDGKDWQAPPIAGTPSLHPFLLQLHTTADGSIFMVDLVAQITIYHPSTQSWSQYSFEEDGTPSVEYFVHQATQDPQGRLWFAGPGITYLDQKNHWNTITHEKNNLPLGGSWEFATSTADGSIWASRNDSIFRYNGQEWFSMPTFDCHSATAADVVRLHADVFGRLWVITRCSTQFALQMYDGKQWHTFDPQNSNMPTTVSNISQCFNDAHGNIWLQSRTPTLRLRHKSLEQIYELAGQLQLSPNPAQGSFTVYLPPKPDGTLGLYDAIGRPVAQQTVRGDDDTVTFDRNNLPKGVYFLQFKTDYGKIYRQKLILL